jgi:hypothetical protein
MGSSILAILFVALLRDKALRVREVVEMPSRSLEHVYATEAHT